MVFRETLREWRIIRYPLSLVVLSLAIPCHLSFGITVGEAMFRSRSKFAVDFATPRWLAVSHAKRSEFPTTQLIHQEGRPLAMRKWRDSFWKWPDKKFDLLRVLKILFDFLSMGAHSHCEIPQNQSLPWEQETRQPTAYQFVAWNCQWQHDCVGALSWRCQIFTRSSLCRKFSHPKV